MLAVSTRRIRFLGGPPTVQSLAWDEGILLSTFCPQIRRYLGEEIEEINESQTTTSTTSFPFPSWRLVDIEGKLHTKKFGSPQLLGSAFADGGLTANHDRLDFLEHSYAVVQDLQSSQIQGPDETFADTTTYLPSFTETSTTTTTSFATSEDSTLPLGTEPIPQSLNFFGAITDLIRVPSAHHLQRLQPQTVTVNLVVGVISLSSPRKVNLRRRPDIEMEIIELLVGDDTRAGFNISFWLSLSAAGAVVSKTTTKPDEETSGSHGCVVERESLESLRPGDVVLLTNVALSEYKGCVYGQSLNQRTTRNRTSVMIVAKPWAVSGSIVGKVGKVREWANRFAGTGRGEKRDAAEEEGRFGSGRSTRRCRREVEKLPPDTQ